MTEISPEEWGNRYRNIRGTCEAMTGRLRTLIVDLLAEANIEVIQIEARTKAVDSFTEKISRKRAKYENPLREITDLVGIRIITYYLEDVAAVGEILKKEFQIDATPRFIMSSRCRRTGANWANGGRTPATGPKYRSGPPCSTRGRR